MRAPPDVALGYCRRYPPVSPVSAREVVVGGARLVQVCSSQYLGMPWRREMAAVLRELDATARPDLWGALGSHYLGGTHPERLAFEREIAAAAGQAAALAFPSGWAANYAVGELVGRTCDGVLSDVRSHNSTIHGLRAARVPVRVVDLARTAVTGDAVDPTWSRVAVLAPSITGLSGEAVRVHIDSGLRDRVLFVLDESHTCGAVGDTGFDLWPGHTPDLRVLGTGKGVGVLGAAVCGDPTWIELLSQLASPWIFSTPVPPVLWALTARLVPQIIGMRADRARIQGLADSFRSRLGDSGIEWTGTHHITGVRLRPESVPHFEAVVSAAGFYAPVSEYPSRPRDAPCARVAFTPFHEDRDVESLAAALLAHAELLRVT